MDLRPFEGWRIVKEGEDCWQLRHSPYPGREMLVCQSDEHGKPSLRGLRDLLNREFGAPPLSDRFRLWISERLVDWSRRLHPDFWPEGRHGMHRREPGGSWLPQSGQHTGVATYRADERP